MSLLKKLQNCPMVFPNGDLKLVIGGKGLLVSRQTLCSSSTVFATLLGHDDNIKLDPDGPTGNGKDECITLWGDDYDTMKILMIILHLQNDKVPIEVTFGSLTQLAKACDKYQLQRCIVPWSSLWSRPYQEFVEQPGYENWLLISTVFRNTAMFTRITRHLILNAMLTESGTLTCGKIGDLGEGIPQNIIDQIKTERFKTITHLHQLVLGQANNLRNDSMRVCRQIREHAQCDAMNLGCLLSVYPFDSNWSALPWRGHRSATYILNCISTIKALGSGMSFHQTHVSYNTATHVNCDIVKTLLPAANNIVNSVQGLTLVLAG